MEQMLLLMGTGSRARNRRRDDYYPDFDNVNGITDSICDWCQHCLGHCDQFGCHYCLSKR